ncbi:unnamed protein product [Blepharisma stoltei]|uniref:EGF-like domain-containing protein n=1 Tax=Blepharisma stoltei TaxID=1481888 RepID=A0AAU9K3G6_9CILI|nr:unnamed protein product [Blepharisma stoltei]
MHFTLFLSLIITLVYANFYNPKLKQGTLTCNSYGCPPTNSTIPSDHCIVANGANYYVSPCTKASTPYCNTTTGLCTANPAISALSYPGEACISSSNCYNGASCNKGICSGNSYLQECSSHEDCSPGLMCGQTNKCIGQIAIGVSGCRDYHDCVNYASCNLTYSSLNGVCVQYATLKNGAVVTDCENGFSHMCASATCSKTGEDFYSTIGVCTDAPMSTSALPTSCAADTDCQGTNSDGLFLTTCECGYTNPGKAFCKPFIGDVPGQNFIKAWVSAMKATNKVCNTARRAANACLTVAGAYESALMATWEFDYYTALQGNDACVKAVITDDYWQPSGSIFLMLSCISALFL